MMRLARVVALLGLLPLAASGRISSIGPVLEPAVLLEDFGGDGLGQFASYPPAQDIGYDPSLTPTASSGSAESPDKVTGRGRSL